ncbi:MAG: type II toxin-antitoxin system ParD family antitoxin [Burkholderiaceae bacterium]|nr:type II toxin-antitoxin system ParD family antitoxin [Roseateles sp.]MBV8469874.1 type II toxin-antitoxin system ParD family antitoxin [Burkholderiaceae bacterium]
MPTRNVVLTAHQAGLVERLVQSGRYQDASEVLREGLRLVEERERLEEAKFKAIELAAKEEWANIAVGRYMGLPRT